MTLFDGYYHRFDLIKHWNQIILRLLETSPEFTEVILPERRKKLLACTIL